MDGRRLAVTEVAQLVLDERMLDDRQAVDVDGHYDAYVV
jgi:hypothetical protein